MRTISERRRSQALAAGMLMAPIAWTLQLQINYSLTESFCRSGQQWILHLVSLGCLLVATLGAAIAWMSWSRLTTGSTEQGDARVAGPRFVALAGLVLSLFFILVIFAMDLPVWWVGACQR